MKIGFTLFFISAASLFCCTPALAKCTAKTIASKVNELRSVIATTPNELLDEGGDAPINLANDKIRELTFCQSTALAGRDAAALAGALDGKALILFSLATYYERLGLLSDATQANRASRTFMDNVEEIASGPKYHEFRFGIEAQRQQSLFLDQLIHEHYKKNAIK